MSRQDIILTLLAPLWVPVAVVLIPIGMLIWSPCLMTDFMRTKILMLITAPLDLIAWLREDWS